MRRDMFLLVRDEDAPTVAEAIDAYAREEGLEPVDLAEQADDPFAMLSVLGGPRVLVSASGDEVAAFGLESLDIAEPEEWGEQISRACSAEVLAFEITDGGVRVHVFDDGELEEAIDVALDPSGRTRAPQLADLSDSEDGKRELASGVIGGTPADLARELVRCFGVSGPAEGAVMLAYVDPLDHEEDPRLAVDAIGGIGVQGAVGGPAASPDGSLFSVTLRGAPGAVGVRLELSGDGLALVDVDHLDLVLRVQGGGRTERRIAPDASHRTGDGRIVLTLDDAVLEPAELSPAGLDMNDMFAALQRIVGAADAQLENTILVGVRGTGRRAGEGSLVLRAAALDDAIAAGEAAVAVHVR
jgi:hypothetical protein